MTIGLGIKNWWNLMVYNQSPSVPQIDGSPQYFDITTYLDRERKVMYIPPDDACKCNYCNSISINDKRGNCATCGAPRESRIME